MKKRAPLITAPRGKGETGSRVFPGRRVVPGILDVDGPVRKDRLDRYRLRAGLAGF